MCWLVCKEFCVKSRCAWQSIIISFSFYNADFDTVWTNHFHKDQSEHLCSISKAENVGKRVQLFSDRSLFPRLTSMTFENVYMSFARGTNPKIIAKWRQHIDLDTLFALVGEHITCFRLINSVATDHTLSLLPCRENLRTLSIGTRCNMIRGHALHSSVFPQLSRLDLHDRYFLRIMKSVRAELATRLPQLKTLGLMWHSGEMFWPWTSREPVNFKAASQEERRAYFGLDEEQSKEIIVELCDF